MSSAFPLLTAFRNSLFWKSVVNLDKNFTYPFSGFFTSSKNMQLTLVFFVGSSIFLKFTCVRGNPKTTASSLTNSASACGMATPTSLGNSIPVGKFSSRFIVYQGKTVLLYYIPESPVPIEVKISGRWVVCGRVNNTTRILSGLE